MRKAVKWNSPFYGVEDDVWFLSFHCFTKYVKVTWFRGTSLRPVPSGESKHKDVRYLDIHEGDVRRSAVRRLGEAGQPIARRAIVSGSARRKNHGTLQLLERYPGRQRELAMTKLMTPRATRRHLLAGGAATLLTSLGALRHAGAEAAKPAGRTTPYSAKCRPSRSP